MKEEKIFKTFRTIVIKADDQEEGVIDMLIPMSTAKTDRHGESIDPKGWKKHLKAFKKRAILLSSHNYHSLQNQIGELLDVQVVEEGLLARPKYYINQGNPEADWGYFLATKGKAAFSVGFIPIKWTDAKDEPTRTYNEQELVEISQVTVPSNTDAAQGLMAKAEYKEYDPILREIIDEIIEDKDFFIEGKKEKYNCECIKCGHKIKSDKHCKDIKCPECGGTMRREERPGPGEKEVKDMVKDKLKDVKADPIDPGKIKVSIERDKEEEYQKVGLLDVFGIYDIIKENKELKEKLKDIELKAGAVLNARNKSNLKNAQALIQTVLDSAGEEEGQEGEEEKDTKTEDPADTKTDDKTEDPGKDEETEEERSKAIKEVIDKTIEKRMNYIIGKTKK